MDFGEAIKQLKAGRHVTREGWNGKGMYLVLVDDQLPDWLPYVVMRTAQGLFQPGWLASQSDILAEDWILLAPDTSRMPRERV